MGVGVTTRDGAGVGVGVGVTTRDGAGVGVTTGAGVAAGVGVTTDVAVFFTKEVKVGPFKSNKPGNQYRQRSFVSAGISTAVHGCTG